MKTTKPVFDATALNQVFLSPLQSTASAAIMLDFPLDCRTVAPFLLMSEKTIRRYVTEAPHRLPRFTRTPTGRIIFWPVDVLDWQRGIRQPVSRPKGRPTKAESIARRQGG